MSGQGTRIRTPSRFPSVHGGAGRLVAGDTETKEEEEEEDDEEEESWKISGGRYRDEGGGGGGGRGRLREVED